MNLAAIAERLELQGQGTRGQDIFTNHQPVTKMGILLRQPFGGSMLDHELPGIRHTSFQLVVRDTTRQAALTRMNAAIAAIATELELDFTGMHVKYIRQRHEPLEFPVSVGNLVELLVNMDTCYIIA
jgi:hypothetical protein